MSTFGGIQFTTNEQISDFVNSHSQDFISMVKSYSVLLGEQSDQSIIDKLLMESYPRIGMKLAAAKRLDNSYLFADPLNPNDLSLLYRNVVILITDTNSPFSEGLVSVAVRYTASGLISALPLNSDIKNIDLARDLHSQAHSDLKDIVELYNNTSAASVIATTSLNPIIQQSLYLSLGIDKTSLPASYFNIAPASEIIEDITSIYPNANIKVLKKLTIPTGYIGVCEFSLTNNLLSSSNLIKGSFLVQTGDTSSSILDELSNSINALTSAHNANILAAPNSDFDKPSTPLLLKKRVYNSDALDPAGIYDSKQIRTSLLTSLDWMSFEPRNLSAINSRELLIVNFYSISRSNIANQINPLATYKGDYLSTSNYLTNDVVTNNQLDYIALSDNTLTPTSSSLVWQPLYTTSDDLTRFKSDSQSLNYIEGLVYGLYNDYALLDSTGPISLLLDVGKGSISATLTPQDTTTSQVVNSFYFKATDPLLLINGTLKCRVSSAFTTETQLFQLELLNATPEDVALSLTNALFTLVGLGNRANAAGTVEAVAEALGVLVQSNAVEIVAFKYTFKNVKVVIDLGIDGLIPSNLQIATGTSLAEVTKYSPKARSIVVDARPEKQFTELQSTNANIDNNYTYSVAKVEMTHNTKSFRSARDRVNLLASGGRR